MKIYHFAFVATMENEKSFLFDQYPLILCSNQSELKNFFKQLRFIFNTSFKNFKKKKLKSYKGYKFGVTLTILDTIKEKHKAKTFYINPLNLKN